METFLFILNSLLFGVALSMDAFSVSMANGLNEPEMKTGKVSLIASVFALFQTGMPMLGWLFVHTVASIFAVLTDYIPYVALALLLFLGIKMIVEGVRHHEDAPRQALGIGLLLVQGVATSIDALSVGFTISDYTWDRALLESVIIGLVTFGLCFLGVFIGRRFGTRLAGKAGILGGVILILIGIEIVVRSWLGI